MNITGMWMWPYSVRTRGAAKTVENCVRAGVTDIYFLTKGLEGTTAFHSTLTPPDCERDLLQELLSEAHGQGIRVHAWFTSACDDHYKHLHPESGRCHLSRGKDRELISLRDEGYLSYMKAVVRDVCRRYDVDGLHLDYIRYNHMLYGWDEQDLARYEKAGADAETLKAWMHKAFESEERNLEPLLDAYRAGDKDLRAFAAVRRQDVWHFAKSMCDIAREEKPGIILSAALMPEGAYEDSAYADLHYGQSYEDAAKLYDFALPMAYSKAYEKDSAWVRYVAQRTLSFGLKTVMGLHAYEDGTGLQLDADMDALRDVPVQGICLFREGASVMAFEENGAVRLLNLLPDRVTRVILMGDEAETDIPVCAEPNRETEVPASFPVRHLRVFVQEKEVSVWFVRKAK